MKLEISFISKTIKIIYRQLNPFLRFIISQTWLKVSLLEATCTRILVYAQFCQNTIMCAITGFYFVSINLECNLCYTYCIAQFYLSRKSTCEVIYYSWIALPKSYAYDIHLQIIDPHESENLKPWRRLVANPQWKEESQLTRRFFLVTDHPDCGFQPIHREKRPQKRDSDVLKGKYRFNT